MPTSSENPAPATLKDIHDTLKLILGVIEDFRREVDQKFEEQTKMLIRHVDVTVENLHYDLYGAQKDKFTQQDEKLQDHEHRLLKLERA